MKTYSETIAYLYAQLPMFSRVGQPAFKKDLARTIALCKALNNPQKNIKYIHVAGTNGKGSSSHMLAAILSRSGYKTGLYTSPHLVDFRERIRIDGIMVPQAFVISFVEKYQCLFEEIKPSFFEVTVAMAFEYFAVENVDIAVIETGLGGRLDSTNIITPLVSLITNIGLDHADILGDSLPKIAKEKAGIIKPSVPTVISEKNKETDAVFLKEANDKKSTLTFAQEVFKILSWKQRESDLEVDVLEESTSQIKKINLDLKGIYQKENLIGVLGVVDILKEQGFSLPHTKVLSALSQVQSLTGMRGRWQTLSNDPLIICDTAHNEHGLKYLLENINQYSPRHIHMVWGMMKDKDIPALLRMLPKEAHYYFCEVDLPRALPKDSLLDTATSSFGLKGKAYKNVSEALAAAKTNYEEGDLIFIGGSTFVVAEAMSMDD